MENERVENPYIPGNLLVAFFCLTDQTIQINWLLGTPQQQNNRCPLHDHITNGVETMPFCFTSFTNCE
jgi:hypothetical protein